MRVSKKAILQGLLFAAPIVLGSTISISPGRAASFASSTASFTLENFNRQGKITPGFPATATFTDTFATDGIVDARANAIVTELPNSTSVTQSSDATVTGAGRKYFGTAIGGSLSDLSFDTVDGLFRFDFRASLSAIARLTNPVPGEFAAATSFLGFQILDAEANELDFFEANLVGGSSLTFRSSPFVQFASSNEQETAFLNGSYTRQFAAGTQLRVRSVTFTTAVATVPEPSMFVALLILPGWIGLRKVVRSCDRQFD